MRTIYYRNIRQQKLAQLDQRKRGIWLHAVNPNSDELDLLAKDYGLNPDLLLDGIDLYESPRLEHEDGNVYIFVRYCWAQEGAETSTQPLLIVVTPEELITVCRREADPVNTLINSGAVVTTQKIKVLLQILTAINRGYRQYLNMVTKQIFASRKRLQRRIVSDHDIINFIDIEEDLNEMLAALQPYSILLKALASGKYFNVHEEDIDLIEDLELSASELIELSKSRLKTLQNMRDAYSTIAANNLNRIFKRLTSIAIFLSIPTIIGGLYGMNIALPFQDNPQAFLIVMGLITVIVLTFIHMFRKRNWL